MKKFLFYFSVFICFLFMQNSHARHSRLFLIVKAPEMVSSQVGDIKAGKVQVPLFSAKRKKRTVRNTNSSSDSNSLVEEVPTGPMRLGSTSVTLSANSDNFHAVIELEPTENAAQYVNKSGQFQLVSTENNSDAITVKIYCSGADGHKKEIFYNDILLKSTEDSIKNPQIAIIDFEIPEEMADLAKPNILYRLVLTISIKKN